YPRMNNSNPLTEPSHPSEIRLNVIGGDSWRFVGDFVEWEVEVEEEGLYQLSFRANQNFKRGVSSNRALYVNGEIPFEEAKSIAFNYDSKFQMKTIGDDEPMLIHLNAGKNIIKLEVVLGEMSDVINETNILITNLNTIYRSILLVTGATPDTYRDYKLPVVIPDLLDNISTEVERLKGIIKNLEEISGGGSETTSSLHTSLIQLEKFIKYPDEIHTGLEEFNSNNAALGTWIQTMKEQPLEIDYLLVTEANAKLPKVNGNFFENMVYESQRFISSFFNDYDSFVTETGEYSKKIEVWVITGRDQSDILRRLIDDSFTPNTGISVDVKLVPESVVLPATLSGEGPDVVIQLNENLPINYALRNALVDLSEFEDFSEVMTRFDESALVPFEYSGGVYALPDEQIHQMLFYREDILDELGLEVPETWDDLFKMLPILNQNHLDFFMDTTVINSASSQAVPNTTYATLLFQQGGEFYSNNGESSALNSTEAMESFKFWTDFYTNYGLPVTANFYNRMRTGEIPIGIASYTNYNLLSVFAPEISGSWKMAPLPSYVNEDGEYNNVAASYVKGSVIFNQSDDKDSAWEFLKWWTSKETQISFGTEIETVLGVAARHASATEEAIYELPWPSHDIEQLKKQRESLQGVPQVPGGYMTAREVEYAFREVINNGSNPRETLYDYIEKIDSELTLKRKEFGIE
ncbi:extracellular solute-binding protein, partial [Turicibacter sanguinis]|nr:extracellular solute-binding protein [Turicibacter sanguinis]